MSTGPDATPGRILVVAGRHDEAADDLAADLGPRALRVRPADLSLPGWTYRVDPARRAGAVAAGRFTTGDLGGVVTCLPCVLPADLPHVLARDRDYVAAEMTAFLRAWLADLACPVVNPPTALCLSGPALSPPEWVLLCAGLGFRVAPQPLRVEGAAGVRGGCRVVVCGASTTATEPCADELPATARRLAAAVRAHWLAVVFADLDAGAAIVGVDGRPDLRDPDVRAGLVSSLCSPEVTAAAGGRS